MQPVKVITSVIGMLLSGSNISYFERSIIDKLHGIHLIRYFCKNISSNMRME